MPDKPTLTTRNAPPTRDVLNGQIIGQAPPLSQATVADALDRIAGHLDEVIRQTGLPLTLALAPYTPQVPGYPMTLRRGTQSATARNLADENFYHAQGYN